MIFSTQEFRSGDDWLEQAASIGELSIEALARRASEWFFLKTTRLRVVLVFVGVCCERIDLGVAIAALRQLTRSLQIRMTAAETRSLKLVLIDYDLPLSIGCCELSVVAGVLPGIGGM